MNCAICEAEITQEQVQDGECIIWNESASLVHRECFERMVLKHT